jgi:hypothetical protein
MADRKRMQRDIANRMRGRGSAPGDEYPEEERGDAWEPPQEPPNGEHDPSTNDPAAPEVVRASDLVQMELPEPKCVVKDLIPEGLGLLAGKPKLGKSWLLLNLALAIACGGVALGKIQVEQGEVLYLALEDTRRRVKSRLQKLLSKQNAEAPKDLYLTRTWPRQDKGGLGELNQWLAGHRRTRLIVIDTWQRFRPPKFRGGSDYEQDYDHASEVKAVADQFGVAIVASHHCRKTGAADPLDEVNGTLGLTGASDAILVLRRERGQQDATLHATGRDIEDCELALQWDSQYALWSIMGQADEYRVSRERTEILDLLRARAEPMSPSEIARALDKSRDNCNHLLLRMQKEGWVKSNNGKYLAAN